MSSTYPENFSGIAPRVSEKFAIARGFFVCFLWAPTIVVPIYALVGAKGGVALPVLAHNSLKLGHLEKSLGIFCRYECPLPTLKISAKSPQGSPRNSRSREVFLYVCFLWAPTIVVPIYAFVGAKGGVALPVLAHNSLKLGHLEKKFGGFCRYECPLPTLKILAESPQGSPRNSRSREVFLYVCFLWAP